MKKYLVNQNSVYIFDLSNKKMKKLQTENTKGHNNSNLSYVDCCIRLTDVSRAFEGMSDDDLDSIYAVAFNRWAYHLTRDGYINALNKKRAEILSDKL